MNFNESNFQDLYKNIVKGFPHTTKRQHIADSIEIKNLRISPFYGMKTLLVRGLALSEDKEYTPLILYKGVLYDKKTIMESIDNNEIVIKCNCQDFYWRFNYYNHLDKSLYGKKRSKYEASGSGPAANPMEVAGMCKHLIALKNAIPNDINMLNKVLD